MTRLKLSELEDLFGQFRDARWSPSRMEVRFGCDCGCGGEYYTPESWDQVEDEADAAIKEMKEFCKLYDIEYNSNL